jgi:tetratricopeptide (TPR) repeat protein
MRKSAALLLIALGACAQAQMQGMHHMGADSKEQLRQGLGNIHHPVSTKNQLAQKFFDQGLALDYGFNHHASERAFRRAAELDPNLAMAHWGAALALGPNINSEIDLEREKAAYAEIQKAQSLASHATPIERAFISALAVRYSADAKPDYPKLAKAYATAMAAVHKQYPDDPDAATLYAESLMDLHPWQMWSADGKPSSDTDECVAVLKETLVKNPNHIGANHFLIHALEASPHPEDAKVAAQRLDHLAPSSGHLVHMPSHIYIRTGNFHEGVVANQKALAVDAAYLENTKNPGVYPMYYMHNFDMLRHAANMEGDFKDSQWAAEQLVAKSAHMEGMPPMDGFGAIAMLNLVRFQKWTDILAQPLPSTSMPATTALLHFCRGMAYVGQGDKSNAQTELSDLERISGTVPAETVWGLNPMSKPLKIAASVLRARLSLLKGDTEDAIAELKSAVEVQDQLGYDEPPDFFYPVRETLGGTLLKAGKAAEAEAVFRKDLENNPGSGRPLFGLSKALEAQNKSADAAKFRAAYDQAWKYADVKLSLDDL